jgi:hypothetical protein
MIYGQRRKRSSPLHVGYPHLPFSFGFHTHDVPASKRSGWNPAVVVSSQRICSENELTES